jgi:hypothetical protein
MALINKMSFYVAKSYKRKIEMWNEEERENKGGEKDWR